MKLPEFSGKPRKFKPLLLRRVVGVSMTPTMMPGDLVIATSIIGALHVGDIVILKQNSREIIKRINQKREDTLFVLGDNLSDSTDSRSFGWVRKEKVLAKVLFPRK